MIELFLAGTDTGVGKTAVGAGLLAAAAARGLATSCLKPAESGCELRDGELWPADAALLARAARVELALDDVCPFRYEEAVAPGVAAKRTGREIDFSRVRDVLERKRATEPRPDLLVVEGAGGLLVPFGGGRLLADLVGHLALPVLVVGRAGLGTINHTLLTVECARARGLEVVGVVLCAVEPEEPGFVASNAAEIERAGNVRVLGVFPHMAEVSLESLARAAEESGALDALLGR